MLKRRACGRGFDQGLRRLRKGRMKTGPTSVKPDGAVLRGRRHGNAEGQDEGQPQACPVETHRLAEERMFGAGTRIRRMGAPDNTLRILVRPQRPRMKA